MGQATSDWWVRQGDREPVGPVSTELLLRGIRAGRVPASSFVCRVGERAWQAIQDVPLLAAAFDPDADGIEERTLVGRAPMDTLQEISEDDAQERTVVDVRSTPSEPPA